MLSVRKHSAVLSLGLYVAVSFLSREGMVVELAYQDTLATETMAAHRVTTVPWDSMIVIATHRAQ